MSLARNAVNAALFAVSLPGRGAKLPREPESIFVLRNNDIGDLLAVTPLFEALKRRFPQARVAAGIGPWNFPVLEGNPWVDEILPVSAPWHNKQSARFPPNSWAGWRDAIRYLRTSPEVHEARARRYAVGIDVLGSPQGSLLMLRARIPYRIGVRGYAGGHTACQRSVPFDPDLHVGRSALRVAEMLGATDLPENRPQLFLTPEEKAGAERLWQEAGAPGKMRAIVAPGGGFPEKCWPAAKYARLAAGASGAGAVVAVIGGNSECGAGREIAAAVPGTADWTGKTSLRETFALISAADLVLTNSSMAMHTAAAFRKRTAVFLGPSFPDAGQHLRQWGYEPDFLMLGDPPDAAARTPEAALELIGGRGWFERRR